MEGDDIVAKHRDIRMLLSPRNLRFVEVTEYDTGGPLLAENLKTLRRANAVARLTRRLDDTSALIRRCQPKTFGELQLLIGRQAGLHALAHGLTFFNIHQALDNSTALMDQPNEDIDAAIFLYARTAGTAL